MFIRIEKASGVPVTRQIMNQIRTLCATGELSPNDRLPSVRELARQLTVNQNTILRVYERLTAEGLLERRHGDGTFVADVIPDQLQAEHSQLDQQMDNLVYLATTLGISEKKMHQLLDRAQARLLKQKTPSKGK
ncbi:MAG: GntR family transcriptional regulator [Phycisphaeraceae bacterium]|nr:GntR family transcriptional regulator [Phycisphaeraceae bacterium]